MPKSSASKEKDGRPFKKARTTGHKLEKDDLKKRASLKDVKHKNMKPSPTVLSPKGKEKEVISANVVENDLAQSSLPLSFKVITGSYEKLLYGLEGTVSVNNSRYSFRLKPIFIFPAHVSCIKAVTASPGGGKWLATGSADEIIKVWDLRRRKEVGGLMHHQGSITYLSFPSRSHLLSASEDGTLCLFRARDWSVLRSMKGHKGRINCVAVHSSGKVALSVGQDKTLRMWDLMRGKGSASTKLGKEGELVRWSTNGSLFVVQAQSTLDLYSTDMTLLHILRHPSRIHDVKFSKRVNGDEDILLIAAEDKKLSVYSIPANREETPTIIAEMTGHTNRVKAVDTLSIKLPASDSTRESTTIVCTISSDGHILLYDLFALPDPSAVKDKVTITPIADYDSKGTRLTCLTLADGDVTSDAIDRKRKLEGENEEEDEDDGRDVVQKEDGHEDEEWPTASENEEEQEEEEGKAEVEDEGQSEDD